MREYDLICIGCGPAGEKAAKQAADVAEANFQAVTNSAVKATQTAKAKR